LAITLASTVKWSVVLAQGLLQIVQHQNPYSALLGRGPASYRGFNHYGETFNNRIVCASDVMIFAGGHVSGAHYNPAVTLGVWIRGACSRLEASFYFVAQGIGAIVAALVAGFHLGHGPSPAASMVTPAQLTRQGLSR
jgi:hypothetical protein